MNRSAVFVSRSLVGRCLLLLRGRPMQTVVRAEPRGSGPAVQDKLSSLLRGWDKLAAFALADVVLDWFSKLDWLEVLVHA